MGIGEAQVHGNCEKATGLLQRSGKEMPALSFILDETHIVAKLDALRNSGDVVVVGGGFSFAPEENFSRWPSSHIEGEPATPLAKNTLDILVKRVDHDTVLPVSSLPMLPNGCNQESMWTPFRSFWSLIVDSVK